jgi:hypothetical protein
LLDVQRTSSIEPLTEVILPDGLLEAINQPETSASDSAEAYAGENTQADLDGMIYTHLQLTMMNNLQGLSPEDATAKVEELGNSITTKAQALDYMNGVSNVPLNNETGAA